MTQDNSFKARRDLFIAQRELGKRLRSIPKKNKIKFLSDLDILIDLAHGDNYENYHFGD